MELLLLIIKPASQEQFKNLFLEHSIQGLPQRIFAEHYSLEFMRLHVNADFTTPRSKNRK